MIISKLQTKFSQLYSKGSFLPLASTKTTQ